MNDPKTALLVVTALAVGGLSLACADSGTRDSAVGQADAPSAQAVRFVTAEFDVEGMTCGGCALATELALKKLDGVLSAEAKYDDETGEGGCTVKYNPALVSSDQMIAAIKDVGFVATPRTRTVSES